MTFYICALIRYVFLSNSIRSNVQKHSQPFQIIQPTTSRRLSKLINAFCAFKQDVHLHAIWKTISTIFVHVKYKATASQSHRAWRLNYTNKTRSNRFPFHILHYILYTPHNNFYSMVSIQTISSSLQLHHSRYLSCISLTAQYIPTYTYTHHNMHICGLFENLKSRGCGRKNNIKKNQSHSVFWGNILK